MKIFPFLLLILALNPLLQRQQPQQQRPQSQSQRLVLADFRKDRVSKPVKIPVATQRAVLTKVFRRYLTDPNRCASKFDAGEDYLRGARKAGQIVPQIAEMETGSFTAAGRTETAYVIFVNECNASHADNFGSKRLAIFSADQLVADVDLDFHGSIVLKTDLNQDGINELLMTSDDMSQGTITQMAVLLSFENGRMRVIQDFGTVVLDSCASAMPGSSAKASLLYVSNATLFQMPKIQVDNFIAGCTEVKRWRPYRGKLE